MLPLPVELALFVVFAINSHGGPFDELILGSGPIDGRIPSLQFPGRDMEVASTFWEMTKQCSRNLIEVGAIEILQIENLSCPINLLKQVGFSGPTFVGDDGLALGKRALQAVEGFLEFSFELVFRNCIIVVRCCTLINAPAGVFGLPHDIRIVRHGNAQNLVEEVPVGLLDGNWPILAKFEFFIENRVLDVPRNGMSDFIVANLPQGVSQMSGFWNKRDGLGQ